MLKYLKLSNLRKNEDGATAIEYGLLAALIAVVIIVSVRSLGTTLEGVFEEVDTEMQNTGTGTGTGG